MKLKLKTVFRSGLFFAAAAFVWCMCLDAQTAAQTNTAATNAPLEKPTSVSRVSALLNPKTGPLTFGLDQIPWLQSEFPEGFPLWQYVASLIYILLAVALSKFLDFVIGIYLKNWAQRTRSRLDDLLLTVIHGPIKVISFVILVHIGLQVFHWPEWVEDLLRKGLKIVVACSITYMALRLVDLFMSFWRQRTSQEPDRAFDEQLFPIINKGLKIFLVIVAVLLTSQNLGLNITSVIASLSIGGLALGLAAQDTLANLFGAVAVFMDKPFRIGDRIRLESVDGTVEAIGLRSTRVRNLDGHFITIPNKTMGNAIITNVTRRPNIKTEMNLGLTYDTSADKLQRALQILEETFRKHPMTFDVLISFNKFADFSLNVFIVHWWNSTDHKAYLVGMQELNLSIKKRFDQEGISFAFPTQTLYVKQDSDWHINGRSHGVGQEETRGDSRLAGPKSAAK